jgi:hypothetical protein
MVSESIYASLQSAIEDSSPHAEYRVVAPDAIIAKLSESIRAVVRERQQLRTAGAGREELERNRLELVELQHRLSEALGARFRPAAA